MDTLAGIRTSEAAAILNRERNKSVLTVNTGIWLTWTNSSRTDADVKVILESIEVNNGIFAGTVNGIVLSRFLSNLAWATSTLTWIRKLRNMAFNLNVKIGSYQICQGILDYPLPIPSDTPTEINEFVRTRNRIIQEVDFVICGHEPLSESILGVKSAFDKVRNQFNLYRLNLQQINGNASVMVFTYWFSHNKSDMNSTQELEDYWMAADRFAREFDFPMWLEGAFDMPSYALSNPQTSHVGWWKLVNDSFVRNLSGYVEKVSGKSVKLLLELNGVNETVGTNDSTALFTDATTKNLVKQDDSDQLKWMFLAVSVVVVVIVICTASGLAGYLLLKPSLRLSGPLTKEEIEEFMHGRINYLMDLIQGPFYENFINVSALKVPYDPNLEIPLADIDILEDEILGSGQFGCVFSAIIRNHSDASIREVALKTTKPGCPSTALKGLLSEIKILQCLGGHPNIISMIGANTANIQDGIVYLAIELCPIGSLKKYLQTCQSSGNSSVSWVNGSDTVNINTIISFTDMLHWSYQITCAMIHLGQKDVIHADLAARNVLLDANGSVKLSDFGLSRRLYDIIYTKRQEEPLPWKWMAIESLKRLQFSFQSDVWSFGVTLWEIFSMGDDPYPGVRFNPDFVESLEDEDGQRLNKPRYASNALYHMMLRCWHLLPEERPLFTEIRDVLEITIRQRTQ